MEIIDILMNSIKNDRVAHAYLFEGQSSSDKSEVARVFAHALLCTEGNRCEKCDNCRMFIKGTHPNYRVLKVEGDVIKIRDHIEPFLKDIRLSSPYSNKKIYIIEEAHKMNTASQNSLLKTLEEPHSDIVIILLTENSDMLLPTIISRVMKYNFESKYIQAEEIDEGVKNAFFKIMKNIESPLAADRIHAVQQLSEKKDICRIYLDMAQEYYRNLLVAKYTSNEMLLKGHKTATINPEGAICAVKIIEEIKFAIKSNANLQLAMDVLVSKLNDVHKREDYR